MTLPTPNSSPELAGREGGEGDIGRHDAEHRGGDVERLAEPVDDVEDDEGPHPPANVVSRSGT